MKYRGTFASVLMMAMLFVGCGANETHGAKKIAEYYKTVEGFAANVEMTVDLGDQTSAFRLAWDMSSNGSRITVLEPKEIAGIGVTVSPDGQTVTYEESALVLPRTDGTAAPMPTEALGVIYDCWRYGIHASESAETQNGRSLIRIDYRQVEETDPTAVSAWFDETGAPVMAEVYYDGVRVIACTFEEFAPR